MKRLIGGVLLAVFSFSALAQTGIPVPSMSSCDATFSNFLSTWNIPGMSVAISKNGKLVYERAFGFANTGFTETTQPYHRFRIASCSKPITSIAIMQLVQNGQLQLSDFAFGPGGIINDTFYTNSIADARMYSITVQNLLEHTAGWDRNINCDGYTGCDPISFPLHVTSIFNAPNPAGDSLLIKFLLTKTLNYNPGTTYAYSNIGYLILGKIIEHITGTSYENYINQNILLPVGICDIALGKNLLAAKLEREAEYVAAGGTYSCYGTGQIVPWQYGGFNLEAMNAHGGWVASSRDLVKLLLAVDSFTTKPDILLPATIKTMTTPSTAYSYYAKGWSVNQYYNWWHMGSLDGTASFIARTQNGYTWAILMNSRSDNSNAFWNALDQLPWNCLASVSSWPTFDLTAPGTGATSVSVSAVTNQSATVSCTAGNGNKRLVVVKQGSPVSAFPVDGVLYSPNTAYGSGTNLGNGNYAVYYGTSNSATITNLIPNTDYYVRIFEATENTTTNNNAIYLLGCSSGTVFHTYCNGSPPLTPTVTITASPDSVICTGASVTFSSVVTNGGSTPIYQWKKNGTNIAGATSASYSLSPANGDIISLVINSNHTCAWPVAATSNQIRISIPTNGGAGTWTWTGATDNNWYNPCNWDRKCLPDGLSDVRIPGGTPFNPTIANSVATCKSIIVNRSAGAVLTINHQFGGKLRVTP